MLSILKGGLISATSGAWITNLPPGFLLAQFRLFGILAPVWFAAVLTVVAALWMRYSALGRAIYAIGGNPDAARRRHPDQADRRVRLRAARLLPGIAAILFASQLQVIQSTVLAQPRAQRDHGPR